MDGMTPGMGHNSGDTVTLDPELIRDQLGIDHKALVTKRDDLLAGYARWTEKFALSGIKTEEAAKKTTDFVKQTKAITKEAEDKRKVVKGPYDAAGQVVQAFFAAGIVARLTDATKAMEKALTRYAEWVDAERRRVAREEEAKQLAESERLAEIARKAGSVEIMDEAVAAADLAQAANTVATASAADLTRTRGDLGGVSSMGTRWSYEVLDLMALVKAVAAGEAPLRYLVAADSVIGPEVRGKTGIRAIPGVRIFEERNVRVR